MTGALAATTRLLSARLAAPAGVRAQRCAFTGAGTATALALVWEGRVPAGPLPTTVTMLALAAVTLLGGSLLARRLIG